MANKKLVESLDILNRLLSSEGTNQQAKVALIYAMWNIESHMEESQEKMQELLTILLPEDRDHYPRAWYDGEELVLYTSAKETEAAANILEEVGCFEYIKTGYYDVDQDINENCVDWRTGSHYISWD